MEEIPPWEWCHTPGRGKKNFRPGKPIAWPSGLGATPCPWWHESWRNIPPGNGVTPQDAAKKIFGPENQMLGRTVVVAHRARGCHWGNSLCRTAVSGETWQPGPQRASYCALPLARVEAA